MTDPQWIGPVPGSTSAEPGIARDRVCALPYDLLKEEFTGGRADRFVWTGLRAYWLITGNLVFEEKGATAMMLAHLQRVPIAPSKRSALAVPACLDRAIMMCLAKEPTQRPASAEVLARVLESFDEVGSWTPDDAERWWRTNMGEGVVQKDDNVKPMHADPNALTTL